MADVYMGELLDISAVDAKELREIAVSLHRLVQRREVAALLAQRQFLGTLGRYADTENKAVKSIQSIRDKHEAGSLGAYAILDLKGDIAGMGTILPGLTLRKQRYAWKPVWARLLHTSPRIETEGPNIAAWTSEAVAPHPFLPNNLLQAYQRLVSEGEPERIYRAYRAIEGNPAENVVVSWTIESQTTPRWIHAAIKNAGFVAESYGIFDVEESRSVVPSKSTLYTAIGDI